jgi:hypothetical protein
MAFVNLPPNLRDMFRALSDRISKLETGPNSAAYDASTALSTANTAYTQSIAAAAAANTAAYQAGVALTAANGKNTVHYSTSSPSGSGTDGDIWFQTDGSGNVLYQFILKSGTWTNSPITSTVIANLDAGKITTGTLTSIAIYCGSSGQFQVSAAGALSATSASISGTINASGGTIGGLTIGTSSLYSGSLTIAADGTISSTNNGYFKHLSINGATLGSNDLAVAGTAVFNSTLTTTGNIYDLGGATTTSTANVYINSVSGLIARSTSSQRYKVAIEEQTIPKEAILALTPKSYVDKGEADAQGTTDGLPRLLGVIAEDLALIPVIKDLLVQYNEEGQPDAVNYDRIAVALIPLLKDHEARLSQLEGK